MTAGPAGQSKTDATLIGQSLAEPEQFGVIFERYFSQIHQYLARRVGAKIADDLTAEVFVAAFAQRRERASQGSRPSAPGNGCSGRRRRCRRAAPGDHVLVQVGGDAGAGDRAEVHADVEALRMEACRSARMARLVSSENSAVSSVVSSV